MQRAGWILFWRSILRERVGEVYLTRYGSDQDPANPQSWKKPYHIVTRDEKTATASIEQFEGGMPGKTKLANLYA